MAAMANRSPSLLLAGLMPGCASVRHQTSGAHRYSAGSGSLSRCEMDQLGAGPGGGATERSRLGHSGTRSRGGLITAQLAKLVVRDHRKMPSLLVSPKRPYCAW